MTRLTAALALVFALAAPAAAQDIAALLARSLGGGAEAAYWLPDSADPARATEAVGVVYLPVPGSAGSVSIEVGHFARTGDGFALAGRVRDLFGHEPRDSRFLPDRIELTTTVLAPGDPRCCPTGTARWAIDRATLAATRLHGG
jgi:hypothetical protein